MRVLVVSSAPPEHTIGGLSVALYDFTRLLTEAGVEVDLMVPPRPVWVLPFGERLIFWKEATDFINANWKDYDVVHVHEWVGFYPITAPFIYTMHIKNGREFPAWFRAKIRTVPSRSYLMSLPYDWRRLNNKVVPNVSYAYELKPTASKEEVRAEVLGEEYLDKKVIGFAGRWTYQKGRSYLRDIVDKFRDDPDVAFWVASDTNGFASDDKVRYMGVVDYETLLKLMYSSDVMFFPSRFESFGLVAVEAAMMETPVVLSACSGFKDITGPTFYHVPTGDVEGYYKALLTAMDAEHSPDEFRAGYEIALPENVLPKWFEVYNEFMRVV